MNRLRGTVTGHGRRVLCRTAYAVVFAAAWTLISAASAQEPDEVPIGTFHIQSPADSARNSGESRPADRAPTDAGSTSEAEPSSWFFQRYESGSPEAMEATFKQALVALNGGRSAEAQRLLERLVAEAPGSALADKARRYLATLYRQHDDQGGGEIAKGSGAGPGRSEAAAGSPAEAAPLSQSDADQHRPATRTSGTSDVGSVPVSDAVEEQFVSEAGDRVFFSSGSSELGTRARGVLQAQARFILRRPDLTALIEGHADDGPEAAEQDIKLSQARADAVRERLIAEGIRPEKLAVVARGREERVSECSDPACSAQNRRAITVLMNARTAGYLDRSRAAEIPQFTPSRAPATQ